jgi:hypothetical protein
MGPGTTQRAERLKAVALHRREARADYSQERLKLTREKTPLLKPEPPPGKGADVSNWLLEALAAYSTTNGYCRAS